MEGAFLSGHEVGVDISTVLFGGVLLAFKGFNLRNHWDELECWEEESRRWYGITVRHLAVRHKRDMFATLSQCVLSAFSVCSQYAHYQLPPEHTN